MNMNLTKAIQDYINKSPYLTNDEVEEATMFNDAGEWAVTLEYICTVFAVNDYTLSPQEIAELESLIGMTKKVKYEHFDDTFLNSVKKASDIYSSNNAE